MLSASATSVAQTLVDLDEIVANLLLLLSEKEGFVVSKRFNLDDSGRRTLEEIGQEFSVTRERIRQVEKTALSKMRRNVFNTPFRYLHEYVSELLAERGGIVSEEYVLECLKKLSPSGFCIGKVRLALSLHEEVECQGNTINFHPYLRDRRVSDEVLKQISGKLVNELNASGDVKNLVRLRKDLESGLKDLAFDDGKLKSLIAIDKRLTILDDDFVGLLEWRHIHPRTLRDKILYILRGEKIPMHFNEIAERIERAKFDGRRLNLQAVHNELIRHNQFILIGRGIYALAEWGYERGTVSEVIEKILDSHKQPLALEEIVEKVLARRQVKRITILLALKNSERFRRLGRKRYALAAA